MYFLKSAEKWNNLFIRNNDMNKLLSEEDRNILYDLITELTTYNYSINALKIFLDLQMRFYSIEIIWTLQTRKIIEFVEFIALSNLGVDNVVETMFFLFESNDELCQQMLTDLLANVLVVFPRSIDNEFDDHHKIISKFLKQCCLKIGKNNEAWKFFQGLKYSPFVVKSTIHDVFKVILKHLLETDIDFNLDIAYEQYRLYKTSDSIYNMFKMFLDEIDVNITYSLIHVVISKHAKEANWKMMLSLITTFVKTKSSQSHVLKLKLEDQLSRALSKSVKTKDFVTCKAALLIFRHCCLEIGLWSEYSRWYSSYTPNVDTAKVFFSLLTELIPYDLPAALAAHISTQPKLTESLIKIQTEYVKKTQARLSEINNGQDYMGLFKDYDDCPNRHEADIVKVLEHFKSTGQVMRVVLEASVFRKKYFVDTFLKTLMSSGLGDDQLKNSFIEKLNNMNKIPINMYKKWNQEQNSIHFL